MVDTRYLRGGTKGFNVIKGFEGYYKPDFERLWNEAVFVFDANVLLDLYRFSPKSRNEMFSILEGLNGRIWIPHQFFHEYHRHKVTIYDDIDSDYGEWENNLLNCRTSAINGLQSELGRIRNRTGFEIDPRDEQVASIFEEILRELAEAKEQHQSSLDDEPLAENIANLFAERHGGLFEESCVENIRELAKERLEKGIPPGSSKDSKKDKSDPDGDLIGWLQTIKYANDEKTPIILVSNDGDWYLTHKGKVMGPYPALLQEMYDKAQVSCYIYKSSQFIKHAQDYLDAQVSDETIEEAENREKYINEQEMKDAYKTNILDNLEERIAANTSVDYMKHAEALLREVQPGQHSHVSAAVLCGAVLEDALWRLWTRQTPQVATSMSNGQPKNLYALIQDLHVANVFNRLKAQQLHAWALIRNSAAHGKSDEFSREDVALMVKGVNNFLADYL